jgi:chemotaxis family two-component system response regulator Rcp1
MDASPIQILLVEDNPDDILLTREAIGDARIANELNAVMDGEAAMAYLRQEGEYAGVARPDLVILDLNLPKKDGRQVLREIREDPELTALPVLVLSTSGAKEDIAGAYAEHVNAYIQKPVDFEEFVRVVRSMEEFWLSIVKLPSRTTA